MALWPSIGIIDFRSLPAAGSSSVGEVAKAAADATQDVERLRQRMDSEYESAVSPAKVPSVVEMLYTWATAKGPYLW